MQVRDVIREAIERKGLSQYRVAVDAGVDRAFLNRVLAGEKPISNELIDKVAPILSLDAEELKAWADVERIGQDGLERIKKYVLPGPIDDMARFVADFTRYQAHRLGVTAKEFMAKRDNTDFSLLTKEAIQKRREEEAALMRQFIDENPGKYDERITSEVLATLTSSSYAETSTKLGQWIEAVESGSPSTQASVSSAPTHLGDEQVD